MSRVSSPLRRVRAHSQRAHLVATALGTWFLWGCGASADGSGEAQPEPPGAGECRTTADCDGMQTCRATPVARAAQSGKASAGELIRPALVAPGPLPCPVSQCTLDEQCGSGFVCEVTTFEYCPTTPFNACVPACSETSCALGQRCGATGRCEVTPCTAQEFTGCPAGWFCDPVIAETGLTDAGLPPSTLSAVGAEPVDAIPYMLEAGCQQLRCNESEGPTCQEGWVCAPELTGEQSVGCSPLPCEEIGHCSDDSFFICEPTSTNTRYESLDPHGCISKNCEEGLACTQYQVCDFGRPDVDMVGCSFLLCTEPNGTCVGTADTVCDPEHRYANVYGCRQPNCTEGAVCVAGRTCDPTDESADSRGCVAPPAMTVVPPPNNDPPENEVPPPNPPMTQPTGAALGGACATDAGCQTGYCVLGICSAAFGQCTQP